MGGGNWEFILDIRTISNNKKKLVEVVIGSRLQVKAVLRTAGQSVKLYIPQNQTIITQDILGCFLCFESGIRDVV